MLTHHSTYVGGKGDAFAEFILWAAAAAPERVSPDDTLKNVTEKRKMLKSSQSGIWLSQKK